MRRTFRAPTATANRARESISGRACADRSAAHQVEGRRRAGQAQHVAQRARGSASERAPIDRRRTRSRAGVALATRSTRRAAHGSAIGRVSIDRRRTQVEGPASSRPGAARRTACAWISDRACADRSTAHQVAGRRRAARGEHIAQRRPHGSGALDFPCFASDKNSQNLGTQKLRLSHGLGLVERRDLTPPHPANLRAQNSWLSNGLGARRSQHFTPGGGLEARADRSARAPSRGPALSWPRAAHRTACAWISGRAGADRSTAHQLEGQGRAVRAHHAAHGASISRRARVDRFDRALIRVTPE